jgi:hypothetical protein
MYVSASIPIPYSGRDPFMEGVKARGTPGATSSIQAQIRSWRRWTDRIDEAFLNEFAISMCA